MTQPWSPIRLQVGPIHVQFGSPHDCRQLLTALLVRLVEQAPAEAAEWVRRDALRLCPTRPSAVEHHGEPRSETMSTRPNVIVCAPDQEHIR
jgi:hypothetical protein